VEVGQSPAMRAGKKVLRTMTQTGVWGAKEIEEDCKEREDC